MIYKILFFIILMCFNSYAIADTESHRKAAEEVLLLMKVNEMMAPVMRQVQQAQIRELQKQDLPDEAVTIVKKYLKQIVDVLVREFAWENWKNNLINSYVGVYSEPELNELIKFYRSPLGKKVTEATPQLTLETIKISQELLKRTKPEIDSLSEAMLKELKQKFPKE